MNYKIWILFFITIVSLVMAIIERYKRNVASIKISAFHSMFDVLARLTVVDIDELKEMEGEELLVYLINKLDAINYITRIVVGSLKSKETTTK